MYQACYRNAHARQPELAARNATIKIRAVVDAYGAVQRASVESTDELARSCGLADCLASAVQDRWFHPAPKGVIELGIPFHLQPPALLPAQASADELLAGGRYAEALDKFQAALAEQPDDARACEWHVGSLRAVMGLEPLAGQPAPA